MHRALGLLKHRGRTLLDATLDLARSGGFDELLVTLGGSAGEVRSRVDLQPDVSPAAVREVAAVPTPLGARRYDDGLGPATTTSGCCPVDDPQQVRDRLDAVDYLVDDGLAMAIFLALRTIGTIAKTPDDRLVVAQAVREEA